jgi:hypothetical protein
MKAKAADVCVLRFNFAPARLCASLLCVCVCCGRRSAAVGVARVTCHGGGDQLLTEYKQVPVRHTSVSELNFSLQLTISVS